MPNPVLTDAIDRVSRGVDLSTDEAAAVLAEIMAGSTSEIEVAGFLIALRTKGETVEEVTGLARTMRSFALPVEVGRDDLVDTAGTGGGRSTFNVSTTAALIATGAGCAVAKHGNRSATSRCGSADLLEALGARIDLAPEQIARCIEEIGFGFMFAPAHHQATKYVVPVRKELAVRTIFNFLGPLTNPAGAKRQVIGVYDPAFTELIAGAALALGAERVLVVSAADGLDEVSTWSETHLLEVSDGQIERRELLPEQLGVAVGEPEAVSGGTPEENAAITRVVLAGEVGPRRDLAVVNAAAAIYAAGRAETIERGVTLAQEAIDSGRAAAALDSYVQLTNDLHT